MEQNCSLSFLISCHFFVFSTGEITRQSSAPRTKFCLMENLFKGDVPSKGYIASLPSCMSGSHEHAAGRDLNLWPLK